MGPETEIAKQLFCEKYAGDGENFRDAMGRIAAPLADSDDHYHAFREMLLYQRFLPAGRIQSAVGSPRQVTAVNCFVSGDIEDSSDSIMQRVTDAFQTMRKGGGIGYDFSKLRPKGDLITSLDSHSSGPVSFMSIFDSVCHTISSSGHRRGAQMGVMRIDHPDIEEFISAKHNGDKLLAFNMSVGVTDDFMLALERGDSFDLRFNGRVYKTVDARSLWDKIMRSTWDYAEPGVLFIDTINRTNNLWYCEQITACNPCAEQMLPPNGACILGSFNLTKYIVAWQYGLSFDFEAMRSDIHHAVRAMDNVIDYTSFPLPEQKQEAKLKRRIGIGFTGLANAGEALGLSYGSPGFDEWHREVATLLRDECYLASIELAKEKGAFPAFDADKYLQGEFIKTLPEDIRDGIRRYGIRNSHLLSMAPTGTISLCADNVSSGIEPVFNHEYYREINTVDGKVTVPVTDYGYREFGVKGKLADQCTVDEHLRVLSTATEFVDSAVSKTINVNGSMPWDEFKQIYIKAWKAGCKGVTTYNKDGQRGGVLKDSKACEYNPETGERSCD